MAAFEGCALGSPEHRLVLLWLSVEDQSEKTDLNLIQKDYGK